MSGLLGTIVPFFSDVRKRCAWQKVDRSHHRPDESFNVAAEARLADRKVFYLHPIFLSAPTQQLGIELWGIVKLQ